MKRVAEKLINSNKILAKPCKNEVNISGKCRSSSTNEPHGLLPKKKLHSPEYTLVLDLDETLIHYTNDEENKDANKPVDNDECYLIRPFALKFIKDVSKYYELVIFTAGTKDYADPIIDDLDPDNLISHRLYRHHTYGEEEEEYIKDLEIIGRSLDSTLIVDNVCDNFKHQKDNGIHIRDWFNDYSDTRLKKLAILLIQMAKMQPKNIAKELKLYREYIKKHIE